MVIMKLIIMVNLLFQIKDTFVNKIIDMNNIATIKINLNLFNDALILLE